MEEHNYDLDKMITSSTFLYYLMAPTLCFQLYYPRIPKIRKWFLAKRCFEFVILVFAQVFVMIQFIYPVLLSAPKVFSIETMNIAEIISYVILLAVQTRASLYNCMDSWFFIHFS